MKSILEQLSNRVRAAISAIGVEGDPLVRPVQDPKFGDYQSNCAMGLAKKLGRQPRELAADIIKHLEIDDLCDPPQIAGAGFINLRLKPDFLASCLRAIPPCDDPIKDRVGVDRAADPETVVVDLSSPNLAKEMHVGHLRSTVIGDSIARILEFEGHTVIRENHVGDWGTQFGMLVAYLRSTKPEAAEHPENLVIKDLESFYVEAKARFDKDDDFKQESRETVVSLQRGQGGTRRIWKAFCDESLRHCHAIYDRLSVRLIDRGESFYADLMGEVIRRLEAMRDADQSGMVRISEGALCLFVDGFTTRDGDPLPMIVRKSDGGFNYSTSDLATILHRVEELGAKRIVYVVGIAQKHHFDMLFAGARQVGFVGADVSLEHVGFGNLLSASGQPFKTRVGGTFKLQALLDEAVARARAVVESREREEDGKARSFSADQIDEIAEKVGLAAVKYADLSHSLTSDYRFDLNGMLSLEGNTAPYMMYAYARIRSIARKAGVDFNELPSDGPILLEHPSEVALALNVLRFAETVDQIAGELKLNVLTEYLFGLAKTFSRFYDRKLGVRVVDASPESVRQSRLRLCDLTARVLRIGLHLLGIETVERM